jgi:hypothetical protein
MITPEEYFEKFGVEDPWPNRHYWKYVPSMVPPGQERFLQILVTVTAHDDKRAQKQPCRAWSLPKVFRGRSPKQFSEWELTTTADQWECKYYHKVFPKGARFVVHGSSRHVLTTTDLGAMTKITLREMTVGCAAEKRFLLCRVQVEPVRDRWRVSTLIEDEEGNVEPLWLFQRELEPLWPPAGAILVIKEPFLKWDLPDSHYLRVDTMIETVEVDPADVELAGPWAVPDDRDANEIKSDGLKLLEAADPLGALRMLRRAIRQGAGDPQTHVAIARCLINDERFFEAIGELELIADPDEPVKELLGDCRYAIRDWAGAAKVYGPEGQEKCKARLAEASGKFNWDAIAKGLLPVVADFQGPIEIKTPKSGRRGVFATRALKPGDLLSVGSAYATGRNKGRHLIGVSIGRSGPGAQREHSAALVFEMLRSNGTRKTYPRSIGFAVDRGVSLRHPRPA